MITGINTIPGEVVSDLMTGTDKRYFNSMFNAINNDIEQASLSNKRLVYKAI